MRWLLSHTPDRAPIGVRCAWWSSLLCGLALTSVAAVPAHAQLRVRPVIPSLRIVAERNSFGDLGFGHVLVGINTPPSVVSLVNETSSTVTISSLTISGANALDFRVRSDSGETVLSPGASRHLEIYCRASNTGLRFANFLVVDSAPESPRLLVLSATAHRTLVERSPASLDFGAQPMHTASNRKEVGVTLHRDPPITVHQVTIGGANAGDFGLENKGRQDNWNLLLSIWFKPNGPGSRSAVLLIYDDAPFSPHIVPLTGFGTPGPPAAPNRLTVRMGSVTQLNLDWTDNSGDEASFELQRQLFGSDWTTIGTLPANSTGFADTGLTPLSIYLYRLRAISSLGPSDWSNLAWITTANPPAAPTGLTATALSKSQIRLSWTDSSSNEHAFAVFRSRPGEPLVRVALLPPNTTSYTDRNLEPDTYYTYRVRAARDEGASAFTNIADATTLPAP
jgi:hypothetical protein